MSRFYYYDCDYHYNVVYIENEREVNWRKKNNDLFKYYSFFMDNW